MSTSRADRRSLTGLVGLGVSIALALAACTASGDPGVPRATPSTGAPSPVGPGRATQEPGPPDVQGLPVPRDLATAFTRLLEQRASALTTGDREQFLATLLQRDPAFVTTQDGYFDNIQQLPVQQLSYELDRASLVRKSNGYTVVVRLTFQLAGFDALPSTSYRRFRFARVGGNRYRIGSVTDRAWQEANGVVLQPWDERPIQARTGRGVLVVLDDASASAAPPLVRSLERGIADVAARVPYDWDRQVVVYALSDLEFLEDLDSIPGEDPDALDAIAFTVPAGPGDARVADTRIALNPRVLDQPGAPRDRLLRHELTHVAVADHDDHAPAWLSEGLAEWVSVQALAPEDRLVSDDALAEAELGVRRMPRTRTFNDEESSLHYAIAWWACEYLARTYGDAAPWTVLDAFTSSDLDERATIEALLQVSVDALARRAAKLMVTTYDPGFYGEPTEPPDDVSPSTSRTPTDEPSPTG